MKKWEYKVEKPHYVAYRNSKGEPHYEYIDIKGTGEDEYLKEMGEAGWELVNVTSPSMGNSYVYHWKREIVTKPEEKI